VRFASPASRRAWARDSAAFARVEGPPALRLIPAHPIPPQGRQADQALRIRRLCNGVRFRHALQGMSFCRVA